MGRWTMDVRVLGEGCHDCLKLELLVGQVLTELGIEANLSRIDDPHQVDRYALAGPPGLVIDGELVVEGRVPSKGEITHWVLAARDWGQRAASP
jgi:small redox-active disulfide protein 2